MRSALTAAFAFTVFALALPQALVLWTAAAGVPLARPLAAAIATAALAGAAWLAARGRRGDSRGAPPPEAPPHEGAAGAAGWLAAFAALLLCAWQWLGLWRLAWARPVYDWDGLYYHLPAIRGWVEAGRVRWIPDAGDLPFANGYPMAIEALDFLVHRLTGSSRLVDAGNLFYWPLALLALAVIATRLGARGPWRFATAALIACVPAWVILSATCYVDPGFAAAAMATLAGALLFAHADDRHASRAALLFGAAGGLVLGAKGQGLPFFAIALGVVTAVQLVQPPRPRARIVTHVALAVLAAFVVGGYWTARDLVMTGNPIFPVQLKLGAKVLATGYDPAALVDGNMPAWLHAWPAWLRVPAAWLQLDGPIRSYAATGGLGVLWPAVEIPALILAWFLLVRRGRLRPWLILAGIAALWLAIQPAPWWARMTLWLHALGLPALAVVLSITSESRSRTGAYAAAFAFLVILAAGAREARGAFVAERAHGRVAGRDHVSSAAAIFPGLEAHCARFLAARHIARSRWSRFGTLMGGVLSQPLDARTIEPLGAPPDSAGVASLSAAGTEWVIWDEIAAGPAPRALRRAALDSCAYRPGQDQRFVMFRIGPRAPGR